MIELLIVDDEMITVDVLQSQIAWTELGIGRLHVAYSMRQACEILLRSNIDILLCDIEMPQGSGLALVEWVRERQHDAVVIFLTGHESFTYASQAIRLRSMEYLVKPVSLERLSEVVRRAVEQVTRRRLDREYVRYGENWLSGRPRLMDQFWLELLTGLIPSEPIAMLRALENRRIDLKPDQTFRLILSVIKNEPEDPDWNRRDLEFALKNVLAELLGQNQCAPVSLDRRHLALVLPENDGSELARMKVKRENSRIRLGDSEPESKDDRMMGYDPFDACAEACRQVRRHLGVSLGCYIGDPVPMTGLVAQLRGLKELDDRHISADQRVMRLGEASSATSPYRKPDMTGWRAMLLEHQAEALCAAVRAYLLDASREAEVDGTLLRRFRQDFLQMVYAALDQHDIPANVFFVTDEEIALYDASTATVDDMLRLVEQVTDKAIQHAMADMQSDSVAERVQRFVRENLQSDISREDIARVVNLNPEYLSRLFKRSTGLSITECIQREKMAAACRLLRETDLPVSEISLQLGYSNFAYFSQIFKRVETISPMAWRKQHRPDRKS